MLTRSLSLGIQNRAAFNLSRIPDYADALIWLDGKMSGENLVCKKTGKLFPVTGRDWDASLFYGVLPYKSAATISAPVDDATLIAADLNSYWYTSGTPNQIPVVSLFQDVDYEHKFFCRHLAQVLDVNGVDFFEPRVSDVVIYNTVKTGVDLVKCQSYYSVPIEQLDTNAVWLSPSGVDATGNGTKALPYRSLVKVKATTKSYIYLKSGDYTLTTSIDFTGGALVIQGLGLSKFSTYAGLVGFSMSRSLTINNIDINTSLSTYGLYANGVNLVVNKVKVTSSYANSTGYAYTVGAYLFTFNNSILIGTLLHKSTAATAPIIDTCLVNGKMLNIVNDTIGTLKNSKLNQYSHTWITTNLLGNTINYGLGGTATTATHNKIVGAVTVISTTFTNNVITGDVNSTINNFNNNTVNGKLGLLPITNQQIKNNYVTVVNQIVLNLQIATNSNITGVVVEGNTFIGNHNNEYIVYIGGITEQDSNCINGTLFWKNKIVNNYVGAGICHTVMMCGGINNVIKFNEIMTGSGYFLVMKGGNVAETMTTPHVSYNILRNTGVCVNHIAASVRGLIVANNTFLGCNNSSYLVVSGDNNGAGWVNSILLINNVFDVIGNIPTMLSANIVARNNAINRNGYTITGGIDVNDAEITTVIDSRGVPVLRVNGGESITGDDNIGLASDYVIPNAITYTTQDGTWQKGAIIL